MKIEELIDKYFEGETTCKEEQEIRDFFLNDSIPEHLKEYQPMFAFFEEEKNHQNSMLELTKRESSTESKPKEYRINRKFIIQSIISIAAGLALLFTIIGLQQHFNSIPASYVMIDGICYTDKEMILEQALNSLNEVSVDEDDFLIQLLSEQ